MTKKLYKIRDKRTGKFISLGYNRRQSWLVYPSSAIENDYSFHKEDKSNYEVVVYEYVETSVMELK